MIGNLKQMKNYPIVHMWVNGFSQWWKSQESIPVYEIKVDITCTAKLFSRLKKQKKLTLLKRYHLDTDFIKGGGWIGVCKSADPLKLMTESVGPLKKSTKSESAITDPSRISVLLFLVIFSTAWHRYIRKRKWTFRGDVEIHDPNFQTTKIQNPGP